MTFFMGWMFRKLPSKEQYPLPPREVTEEVTEDLGLRKYLNRKQMLVFTLLAHFAYGSTTGLVLEWLAPKVPPNYVTQGLLFGLIVWVISYLGILPVLGLLRPATKHPPRRNSLMIAAHLVCGVSLGALLMLFERWLWVSLPASANEKYGEGNQSRD